jgi:hypothetical protein
MKSQKKSIASDHAPEVSNVARNHTKLVFISMLSLLAACAPKSQVYQISEQDKREIKELKQNTPMILANQGWEAYEQLFSEDYQNWSMMDDNVRERDEFLQIVKLWYEAGNRAVDSDVASIAFIPLTDKKVLYLSKQVESFSSEGDEDHISRDIRFVSVFVKEKGTWKMDFSAFMDAHGSR